MCKIREELRQVKGRIISQAAACQYVLAEGERHEDSISPHRWKEIVPGVNSVLCALDDVSDNRTVVNCVFNPGTTMEPHQHDRVEMLHVISGDIMETVTGSAMQEGDSMRIESFVKHGWHSKGGCMLTVSWKPAYLRTPITE